ncbi:hypothetical protein PR202_ga23037 [Eleusine coracana subsp. coracana]|uniref:Glycosyltransferase N-terminal domain-containing protein n=1 Tax=Eleusine coracana subsp. coracana TaxID=191504 RepID=A0AAV5D576_ELECO|nr:hypothetical protein PR202_ga23037 [Eleusine coracana subsp. coracana]
MNAPRSDEFMDYVIYVIKRSRPSRAIAPGAGVLLNTCHAFEGEFIDVVADNVAADGKKLFAVEPLNSLLLDTGALKQSEMQHECLELLEKQPLASVLYVSFGTTSTLPVEQVVELASALCDSKQRFIWVLRNGRKEAGGHQDNGKLAMLNSLPAKRLCSTPLVLFVMVLVVAWYGAAGMGEQCNENADSGALAVGGGFHVHRAAD